MSEIIRVSGGGFEPYDVVIGCGLITQLGTRVAGLAQGRTVIVTDETVAALHGPAVLAGLEAAGVRARLLTVPPGEASKSFAGLEHVIDRLLAFGLDRRDLIVALGGGVVGDLAGLAAALYMRGIDFVQVPTTLLAQVDSSVGARRRSIPRAARTWSVRFTSRGSSSPTSTCWPRCRRVSCDPAGPRC